MALYPVGIAVYKLKPSIAVIGASTLSLVGVIAFAMTTNLHFDDKNSKTNLPAPSISKTFGVNEVAEKAVVRKLPVGTENSPEGKLSKVNVTAGPFDIHRKYRSMEGPYVSLEMKVGDMVKTKNIVVPPHYVQYVEGGNSPSMNGGDGPSMKGGSSAGPSMSGVGAGAPNRLNSPVPLVTSSDPKTIYWMKGIKLIVMDENNKPCPTAEFICHLNVDLIERSKVFSTSKMDNGRLFTLTQGQTEFHFPNGFAVPLSSKEKMQITFQAANRTTTAHRRLKHLVTFDFIKDSDLQKDVKALAWDAPYAAVVLGKDAQKMELSHHGPSCLGVSYGDSAPNSSKDAIMADSKKRLQNGHWVIPPGLHTFVSPVDDERNVGFNKEDRIVHAVWSHMHPLCTDMELNMCDGEKKTPMWKVNIDTDTSKGLEIRHIDNIYSQKGIKLPKNMHYEISGTYNNTTGTSLDSMLTFGIFFEDPHFARPDWSHDTPDNMPDKGKSQDYGGMEKYAMFNDFIDGPLLTDPKHLNVTTSAGDIHLVLNPAFAPRHATQIYRLFRSGAYDGTTIFHYSPNFIIQFGSIDMKHDNRQRLADLHKEMIRRIPLEVHEQENGVGLNTKWALSMSRPDADDSATSSFSILLADSPHLNGTYTVFGSIDPDATTLATLEVMKKEWAKKGPPFVICASEDSNAVLASAPQESTKDCKLYCGIKPTQSQHDLAQQVMSEQQAKVLQTAQIPRFDVKKDGPLLTDNKPMEIKTSSGNIHVVIDPSLAPQNATQMYRLFKAGAFTDTTIPRYEKDFVLQISLAQVKSDPTEMLAKNLAPLIRRLPLEISKKTDGLHKRFVLSMAHEDADVNSGTTSFSILLGSAPHLDKKYTVFGHVVDDSEGRATIARLEKEFSKQHPPRIISISDRSTQMASAK